MSDQEREAADAPKRKAMPWRLAVLSHVDGDMVLTPCCAPTEWAHYADETSRWYVVTAYDLLELCNYLDDDDEQVSGDAYSHWCAAKDPEEMPLGWMPDSEVC